MTKFNAEQQREILEMQAELARLRIAAEYLKKRQEDQRQQQTDLGLSRMMQLADDLPSGNLLWKTVFLPLRWKHRLLAAAALLIWQMWRKTK